MVEKTVLHSLNSGLVLDRSVFVGLSANDMLQTIGTIRAAGIKKLYIIDGAEAFFTAPNLINLIHVNDPMVNVVNEALGGFFTNQQIDALTAGPVIAPQAAQPEVQQHQDGDVIVNMGQQPQYIFAQVPQGWSVGNNMSLGQNKIKRKVKNGDGDGTMFYMSPADFEKLWLFASQVWAGVPGVMANKKFNTGMGSKLAVVMADRISIGGNYIRRYEIEQVAKYRGWAMPNAAKIAA